MARVLVGVAREAERAQIARSVVAFVPVDVVNVKVVAFGAAADV